VDFYLCPQNVSAFVVLVIFDTTNFGVLIGITHRLHLYRSLLTDRGKNWRIGGRVLSMAGAAPEISAILMMTRINCVLLNLMSPFQDDDFSKAYTTALYRTKGIVKTNVLVKSDENLAIDLMFVGNFQNLAWTTENLGLFDNLMQVHPTIFVEHYSGYLNPSHILRCITRMDLYVSGEKKAAKKRDEKLLDQQKPFTWILATACSVETLESFGANPDFAFGSG
jgi:hypothetical protein